MIIEQRISQPSVLAGGRGLVRGFDFDIPRIYSNTYITHTHTRSAGGGWLGVVFEAVGWKYLVKSRIVIHTWMVERTAI